jgi:hypothetical protein
VALTSSIYGNKAALSQREAVKRDRARRKHRHLPAPIEGRTWLRVPYEQRKKAAREGARWSAGDGFWWIPTKYLTPNLYRWLDRGQRPK